MLCGSEQCRFAEETHVRMCILFVNVNNEAVDDNEYQVIVAMNRDEFIDRPTLPAHFWNEHCISGQLQIISKIINPCLRLNTVRG